MVLGASNTTTVVSDLVVPEGEPKPAVCCVCTLTTVHAGIVQSLNKSTKVPVPSRPGEDTWGVLGGPERPLALVFQPTSHLSGAPKETRAGGTRVPQDEVFASIVTYS